MSTTAQSTPSAKTTHWFAYALRQPVLHLALVGIIYLALLLPTAPRQGISWDEQTDLSVARAYLEPWGWLRGSDIDASQTRLPMLPPTLIFMALGRADLLTARWVSIFVGLFTLLGVYVFCQRRLSHTTGILACLMLAISPFFLSFARVAFTETDIYLTCTLAWLVVCVDRLRESSTLGRAALTGVVLGLCLSAKFTSLAIVPAVWLVMLWNPTKTKAPGIAPGWLILATAGLTATSFVGKRAAVDLLASGGLQGRLGLYLVVLLIWFAALVWAARNRQFSAPPILLAAFITATAALTFLVVPPEHLTNPHILQALMDRYHHEMKWNPGFMMQAGGLHLLSILFKSSPGVGMGLLVGWGLGIWAVVFEGESASGLRFPALASVGYFGGLILLPLAQTFYSVPILPLLAIFAAYGYLKLLKRWRKVMPGLGVLVVAILFVDLSLCGPDYNLNGYQYLGTRIIAGRASIGYRSVVQTPSDGVQQVFEWLNAHAERNQTVTSYVLEEHILQATAPSSVYQIQNGLHDGTAFPTSDYVVTAINAQVQQSWWTRPTGSEIYQPRYDTAWLENHYTQVYRVERAFGIEMASVWKKKSSRNIPTN